MSRASTTPPRVVTDRHVGAVLAAAAGDALGAASATGEVRISDPAVRTRMEEYRRALAEFLADVDTEMDYWKGVTT